jgi:SRSO17 transposase
MGGTSKVLSLEEKTVRVVIQSVTAADKSLASPLADLITEQEAGDDFEPRIARMGQSLKARLSIRKLIADEGRHSACIARQCCGNGGKVENC